MLLHQLFQLFVLDQQQQKSVQFLVRGGKKAHAHLETEVRGSYLVAGPLDFAQNLLVFASLFSVGICGVQLFVLVVATHMDKQSLFKIFFHPIFFYISFLVYFSS